MFVLLSYVHQTVVIYLDDHTESLDLDMDQLRDKRTNRYLTTRTEQKNEDALLMNLTSGKDVTHTSYDAIYNSSLEINAEEYIRSEDPKSQTSMVVVSDAHSNTSTMIPGILGSGYHEFKGPFMMAPEISSLPNEVPDTNHNMNRSSLSVTLDRRGPGVMINNISRSRRSLEKNCSVEKFSLRCLIMPQILIEPRLMCGVPHTYVIYVLTTIGPNTQYDSSIRDLIRQTWANYMKIRPYLPISVSLRLMFVIGRPIRYTRNAKMISMWNDVILKLRHENSVHNDILLANFEDNYDSLTYKGIVALKWLKQHCRLSMLDYVAKVDEDVFINTGQIIRKLACKIRLNESCHFSCMQINEKKPQYIGKWRIGRVEFNDTFYPDYCSGHAYFLCRDGFKLLMRGIENYPFPYWRLEDVFITGFLPKWASQILASDEDLIYTRLHQYQYIRDARNISDPWLAQRDFIHGLPNKEWVLMLQRQLEQLQTAQ